MQIEGGFNNGGDLVGGETWSRGGSQLRDILSNLHADDSGRVSTLRGLKLAGQRGYQAFERRKGETVAE